MITHVAHPSMSASNRDTIPDPEHDGSSKMCVAGAQSGECGSRSRKLWRRG